MMKRRLMAFLLCWALLCSATVVFAEDEEASASNVATLVRAGGSFCLALDAQGGIWGWGDNASGQLGNGNAKRVYQPELVAVGLDGTQVKDIQCGNVSTLFLMKDGTVYTCGNNNYKQQGFPEAGARVKTPAQIPGLENIITIACGFGQCLALDTDGHVWAWGRNSNGQIGNGTKKSPETPVMLDLENIVDVKCGGKFCLALAEDGTLWGWGENDYGQLGNVSKKSNVLTPTELPMSGRFVTIACGGDVAFGLDTDGKLWAWGRNDYWQLGVKDVNNSTTEPVAVALPDELNIARIFAYNSHTSILTDSGAVWTWGGVYHGQVGNGKRPWRDVPLEACPVSGAVDIGVGSLQSVMLLEDGTVMGCGCNEYGQTGAFSHMSYYVASWMNTGLNLNDCTWVDPKN